MELEPFCRAEFPRWIEHVSSFLQARGEGAEVLFVSYESLLRETAASLGAILRWLDIGHTEANLLRAVNNMAFAKLRRLEEVRRKDAREYFFRKGREGSGPEELSAEPVRRIRDGAALVMARAEEEAARSRSQAAAPEKLNSAAAPGPGAGRCAPSPAARSAAAGFPACRGESG
jgi:predicted ATPase